MEARRIVVQLLRLWRIPRPEAGVETPPGQREASDQAVMRRGFQSDLERVGRGDYLRSRVNFRTFEWA